jgi:hypothetical protein
MRNVIAVALTVAVAAVSVSEAKTEGLVPCDDRAAGFVEDLSDDSKGSSAGEVIVSFLDLPGLSMGWGFQIAAELDVDGYSDLALPLDFIVKYSVYVLLNAGLVFGIAVPIYLPKKWWPSLIEAKAL